MQRDDESASQQETGRAKETERRRRLPPKLSRLWRVAIGDEQWTAKEKKWLESHPDVLKLEESFRLEFQRMGGNDFWTEDRKKWFLQTKQLREDENRVEELAAAYLNSEKTDSSSKSFTDRTKKRKSGKERQ
jgi:hypothetical protein